MIDPSTGFSTKMLKVCGNKSDLHEYRETAALHAKLNAKSLNCDE
jgi:hypothetical protein